MKLPETPGLKGRVLPGDENPITQGAQCPWCKAALFIPEGYLLPDTCPACNRKMAREPVEPAVDSAQHFRERMTKPVKAPTTLTPRQYLEILTNGDCATDHD